MAKKGYLWIFISWTTVICCSQNTQLLFKFIRQEKANQIDLLLNFYQLSVDLKDASGKTGLIYALEHNRPHIAYHFLKRGAQVNTRLVMDHGNKSTLHFALCNIRNHAHSYALCKKLIERGCPIEPCCTESTALEHAASIGNLSCVTLLIERLKERKKMNGVYPALLIAIQKNHIDIALKLMSLSRLVPHQKEQIKTAIDKNVPIKNALATYPQFCVLLEHPARYLLQRSLGKRKPFNHR